MRSGAASTVVAEMADEASSQMSSGQQCDESLKQGCYCRQGRNLKMTELQCGLCNQWFHAECISCYLGKCIPFMTSYVFVCKRCNPGGSESFNKKQATFTQICQTTIANLTVQNPDKKTFSRDRDIIPYIEKYWENLTTMQRRVKLTWHATVAKTLSKESETFICVEEAAGDPYYCLRNSDLSKVGPNYKDFKLSEQVATPASDGKGRTSKRKALGDSQVLMPSKQKKGDQVGSNKLVPHGYPIEHPFNKDGYRYVLAESDPQAPNRQAFDDSTDGAGKPIPGYLYRTFLGSQVLLALHDRAPQLKISEDRLSVTGEKGYSMVRATHAVNKGAWYFEAVIDEMPLDSAVRMGWSQQIGNLQAPCGYDKFSYSWRSRKGTKFHQSMGRHYGDSGYGEGDVLGFFIQLPEPTDPTQLLPATYKDKPLITFKSHLYYEEKDSITDSLKSLSAIQDGQIYFYKNGQCQGLAFSDIYSGWYFPCVSLYKNATVTLNFGPDFKFPPTDRRHRPFSEAAQEAMVEHALLDVLYHVEYTMGGSAHLENNRK